MPRLRLVTTDPDAAEQSELRAQIARRADHVSNVYGPNVYGARANCPELPRNDRDASTRRAPSSNRQRGVTAAEPSRTDGAHTPSAKSHNPNSISLRPTTTAEKGHVMTSKWRNASIVQLVEGYQMIGRDGQPVDAIDDVRIQVEGGFLHIQIAKGVEVQLVSAPAVKLVTYSPKTWSQDRAWPQEASAHTGPP